MKRILLALSLAAASAVPAFAQDAAELTAMACADFAAMDNAGQQATVARIQSAASEMEVSQTLMANDIFSQLSTQCTDHPDMLIMDVVKAMK